MCATARPITTSTIVAPTNPNRLSFNASATALTPEISWPLAPLPNTPAACNASMRMNASKAGSPPINDPENKAASSVISVIAATSTNVAAADHNRTFTTGCVHHGRTSASGISLVEASSWEVSISSGWVDFSDMGLLRGRGFQDRTRSQEQTEQAPRHAAALGPTRTASAARGGKARRGVWPCGAVECGARASAQPAGLVVVGVACATPQSPVAGAERLSPARALRPLARHTNAPSPQEARSPPAQSQ